MVEHPYMKLYGRDYLASTRHLTCAARGVYVDLLILSWFDDGVPADPEVLRRMVGADVKEWRTTWPQLETKWPVSDDGRRRNPREESERAKALVVSSKRSASGHAGAVAKRQANAKQTPSKPEANGHANGKLSVSVAVAKADPPATASKGEAVATPTPATPAPFDAGELPTRRWSPNAVHRSRIGLDVPDFLHRQFTDRLRNAGHADPEAVLLAWYVAVEDQWRGRAVGEKAPKFWEARFEEWQGRTALAVVAPSKASAVAEQNARVLAEYRAQKEAARG